MELVAQLDDAGTRSADAVARLWRAGELSAKKDGIGVYKVPLCLAVSGQHGLANNALDEIVASLQRSPGGLDEQPPPQPKPPGAQDVHADRVDQAGGRPARRRAHRVGGGEQGTNARAVARRRRERDVRLGGEQLAGDETVRVA